MQCGTAGGCVAVYPAHAAGTDSGSALHRRHAPGPAHDLSVAGETTEGALHALLIRYLGSTATERVFTQHGSLNKTQPASSSLITRAEQALAGSLGSASASVLINSVLRGEALDVASVMSILDTTSQTLEYNRRLEQKSQELARVGKELRSANERLRELDRMKDEFVAMVSHELRTP